MYEQYFGERSSGCLLFLLEPRLMLRLIKSLPDHTIEWNDVIYHDITNGDSNGFYDWLRNSNDEIVGLRYSPHVEKNFLLQQVNRFSYIEVIPGDCFMIYFGIHRNFDPTKSVDQDFGGDVFYCSASNDKVFSVGTKSLNEKDIIRIVDAGAIIDEA
jgi:hypothetical protein